MKAQRRVYLGVGALGALLCLCVPRESLLHPTAFGWPLECVRVDPIGLAGHYSQQQALSLMEAAWKAGQVHSYEAGWILARWAPGRLVMAAPLRMLAILTLWLVAALAVWFRFGKSTPDDGRCKRCGYDLTGNLSGRCPECGTATRQRDDAGVVECHKQ
jgi:hypothetical protein